MIQVRRVRFRWRRALTVLLMVYFTIWIGISCWHMVGLWRDEQQWHQKIAVARELQSHLRADVRQLRNPVAVKNMIQGTQPIPDPAVTGP